MRVFLLGVADGAMVALGPLLLNVCHGQANACGWRFGTKTRAYLTRAVCEKALLYDASATKVASIKGAAARRAATACRPGAVKAVVNATRALSMISPTIEMREPGHLKTNPLSVLASWVSWMTRQGHWRAWRTDVQL